MILSYYVFILLYKCSSVKEYLCHLRPCIDVDKHVPICELNTWITNGTFTLLHQDKNILLHPAAWLTSSIITAAQNMLKEQHGSMGGLQDPCLSQSMGFRKVSGDFVQVVHNGFGHWLTVQWRIQGGFVGFERTPLFPQQRISNTY